MKLDNKRFGDFVSKAEESSDSIIIEGYANKAVIDRGNDYIPAKAWMLEEFKKNPIIFLNHDRNIPIGKAIAVEVKEDGLMIRAEISKSKAAPIPYVRDMIKERILRTFSVGFDPMDSVGRADGVNQINKANLLEVSVVSIPMNQESDFDLAKSCKAFTTKSYDQAVAEILNQRGNRVMAKLHKVMASKIKNSEDRKKSMQSLVEQSGHTEQEILNILSGLADPTSKFLDAFKNIFDLDSKMEDEEDKEPKACDDEDKGDGYDEDKDKDSKMEDEEDPKMEDEEDKEKQAVPKGDDETEFGNPHLTVAKSHLALAGAMVKTLEGIQETMSEVKQLLVDVLTAKQDAPMPIEEDDEEEMAQSEEEFDKIDSDEDEEDMEKFLMLDRKRKIIENFEKRLQSIK